MHLGVLPMSLSHGVECDPPTEAVLFMPLLCCVRGEYGLSPRSHGGISIERHDQSSIFQVLTLASGCIHRSNHLYAEKALCLDRGNKPWA